MTVLVAMRSFLGVMGIFIVKGYLKGVMFQKNIIAINMALFVNWNG